MGYGVLHNWGTLTLMQRLFTMFPSGMPGLALVLLRVSVAIALLLECYAHRQELQSGKHAVAILLALALWAGFLTPIVVVLALVLHGLIWSNLGIGSPVVASIVVLDALALAFLGPGAYSLDSRRYGRRVVVLPPT